MSAKTLNKAPSSESPSYSFDADKLAELSNSVDPVSTRKELLRLLGGMMAAAAGRQRRLKNGHRYDDPDFISVLRGFELAGAWLGINRAPGDPKALLELREQMKAIMSGSSAGPKRARGRAKKP